MSLWWLLILPALFLAHRGLIALEEAGVIYYRNASGGAGAALSTLHEVFQPDAAKVTEVQQEADDADDNEGNAGGPPGGTPPSA